MINDIQLGLISLFLYRFSIKYLLFSLLYRYFVLRRELSGEENQLVWEHWLKSGTRWVINFYALKEEKYFFQQWQRLRHSWLLTNSSDIKVIKLFQCHLTCSYLTSNFMEKVTLGVTTSFVTETVKYLSSMLLYEHLFVFDIHDLTFSKIKMVFLRIVIFFSSFDFRFIFRQIFTHQQTRICMYKNRWRIEF